MRLSYRVFLGYYRIWGIPARTCSICEQLLEIQCTDFESKEQTAMCLSPRKIVSMIFPPKYGGQSLYSVPKLCKVLAFLALCMSLCLGTVYG